MNFEEIVKLRQLYNKMIIEKLSKYIEANEDIRFIQALQNLGIVDKDGADRFYEESLNTWKIVEKHK